MRRTYQLVLRFRAPRPPGGGLLPDLSCVAAARPLRNGNPRGNPNAAPRCGAKTRAGTQCRCPAMRNGRCRMHGGASTGPRTAAGRRRIARARTKHGRFSAAARRQRAETRARVIETNALLLGARALNHLLRRGRQPSAFDAMHLTLTPFLPPGLYAAAMAGGVIGEEEPMHRETAPAKRAPAPPAGSRTEPGARSTAVR